MSSAEDSRRRIFKHLGLNASLVSKICRRLLDVCSKDLQPLVDLGLWLNVTRTNLTRSQR